MLPADENVKLTVFVSLSATLVRTGGLCANAAFAPGSACTSHLPDETDIE